MAQILEFRDSEEPRHQILRGLEEYRFQQEMDRQFHDQYVALQQKVRMGPEELERVQPSLIDKLMPWIMVIGFLLIFLVGGSYLVQWIEWLVK